MNNNINEKLDNIKTLINELKIKKEELNTSIDKNLLRILAFITIGAVLEFFIFFGLIFTTGFFYFIYVGFMVFNAIAFVLTSLFHVYLAISNHITSKDLKKYEEKYEILNRVLREKENKLNMEYNKNFNNNKNIDKEKQVMFVKELQKEENINNFIDKSNIRILKK